MHENESDSDLFRLGDDTSVSTIAVSDFLKAAERSSAMAKTSFT
jgi:hypothetical protein